jgi:hypothetical protein
VVAGAVACLLGNILYCFSYDARALWMLVLSRFVMGFGAGPAGSGRRRPGRHHCQLTLHERRQNRVLQAHDQGCMRLLMRRNDTAAWFAAPADPLRPLPARLRQGPRGP